jgi:hypothetical protein
MNGAESLKDTGDTDSTDSTVKKGETEVIPNHCVSELNPSGKKYPIILCVPIMGTL